MHPGWDLLTAEHDGHFKLVANASRSTLRRTVGKRIRVHIAVHDFAGNTKTFDRVLRITHG
jgi:hypothetical protein